MAQKILAGRYTASFDASVVVFVIGVRINAFLKIGKWLPVVRAMSPMIAELSARPDSGFLGAEFMLELVRHIPSWDEVFLGEDAVVDNDIDLRRV